MKNNVLVNVFFVGLIGLVTTNVGAGTIDTLVDKLCKNGGLTAVECQELRQIHEYETANQETQNKKINELEKKIEKNKVNISHKKGNFKWSTADKRNSINLEGRVQLDARSYSPGGVVNDVLDIRRMRLGAKLKIDKDYSIKLVGNYNEGSAAIDTATLSWKFAPTMSLVLGKDKLPVSLENMTSSRFIDFVERSIVNHYGGGGKKYPAMQIKGKHGYGFWGVGYGATGEEDTNDQKQFVSRVTANFGKGSSDVIHMGLSYSKFGMAGGNAVTVDGGPKASRGSTWFGASTIDTGTNDWDMTRIGYEAAITRGNFKFQMESMANQYEATLSDTTTFDKEATTQYISLMWLATGENYGKSYSTSKGAFGAIKPNGDGAWELGVRFASHDADDFKSGNGPVLSAGKSASADVMTYGIKYMPNINTRFMLNFSKADYDTAQSFGGSQKAVLFRGQMWF